MATMHIEHHSRALARNHSFILILPEKMPPQFAARNPAYQRPPKTVVLLHGYTGSATDWLYHTPAASLAQKYNLAMVFADGDISFFLDREATGMKYGQYIGSELIQYLRDTFGIAASPEDVIIGGNSMGGFGAIRTALAYPENYGGAFGLSPALIIRTAADMTPETAPPMSNFAYYQETFGPLDQLLGSEKDPEFLVKRLKEQGKAIPRLFLACGTEDRLVTASRQFRDFLREQNVPVTYEEGSGIHNWDYWIGKFEPALKVLLDL